MHKTEKSDQVGRFSLGKLRYPQIAGFDRKRLAGLMDQAYFGRKKPQTTPDEDAALSMLRENPEVLKLLLAMRK